VRGYYTARTQRVDLLDSVGEESRNQKPPDRVGLFQPKRWKTAALLLAWMRPSLSRVPARPALVESRRDIVSGCGARDSEVAEKGDRPLGEAPSVSTEALIRTVARVHDGTEWSVPFFRGDPFRHTR